MKSFLTNRSVIGSLGTVLQTWGAIKVISALVSAQNAETVGNPVHGTGMMFGLMIVGAILSIIGKFSKKEETKTV